MAQVEPVSQARIAWIFFVSRLYFETEMYLP